MTVAVNYIVAKVCKIQIFFVDRILFVSCAFPQNVPAVYVIEMTIVVFVIHLRPSLFYSVYDMRSYIRK